MKNQQQKKKKFEKPAKAPITKTELRRVLQNLQQQTLKCKQLEKQISKMNKKLQLNNANLDNTLNKNFLNILYRTMLNCDLFEFALAATEEIICTLK